MSRQVKTSGRKVCMETKRRINDPESSRDDFESTFDKVQRSRIERKQKSIRNASSASSSSEISKKGRKPRKRKVLGLRVMNYSSSLEKCWKPAVLSKAHVRSNKRKTLSGRDKENERFERPCFRATNRKRDCLTVNYKQEEADSRNDSSLPILEVVEATQKRYNTRSAQRILSKAESSVSSKGNPTKRTFIDNMDDSVSMDAEHRLLKRCNYNYSIDMQQHFHQKYVDCMKKIGEGIYSEVFSHSSGVVLKIMPIEGSIEINDTKQKQFHEILPEVIMARELSQLRYGTEFKTDGFVELKASYCLKGRYTPELLKLWDDYDNVKSSENDRPDIFEDQQTYLMLEFENAGRDLEGYIFNTAAHAWAVFLQLAHTVAVAECCLEFEHRDFHWGNVLLSKTKEKWAYYNVHNREIAVETDGLKATVIDYTLSRMKYKDHVVYNNLEDDKSLFHGEGDYQFEIYRKMRREVGKHWKKFCPKTNVFWLHYLLEKLTRECRYKHKELKKHRRGMRLLKQWRAKVLEYPSALRLMTELPV